MLVLPGFRGPDRSFEQDDRRDIQPKTFSLGRLFVQQSLVQSRLFVDHGPLHGLSLVYIRQF